MSRIDDIRNLITKHDRHLQKLKEQQASLGIHTPAHILTSIEDTETEIENLQAELQRMEYVSDVRRNTTSAVAKESPTPVEIKSSYGWITKILSLRNPWLIVSIGAILLVSVLSIGYLVRLSRYSSFASAFTPAKIGLAESNAKIDAYVASKPNLPDTLTWYKYGSEGLSPSSSIEMDHSELENYLYYGSTLNIDTSWTAVFFWRTFPVLELNASNKSELIAIIYAEEPDKLEIGFKDMHDNERKIGLPVIEGWAGYKVSLDEFPRVDFNRIQLFSVAHTRYLARNDTNVFKLALLDLQ